MRKQAHRGDQKDTAKYIYFNINIKNTDQFYIPAVYSETRTTPIIGTNLSEYKAAVARFKIPSDAIPLMVFNQADDLKTSDYVVTIIDTLGNPHSKYCIFINTLPGIQSTFKNFVYYYTQLTDSINTALYAAFLDIPVLIRPAAAPFILYNATSKKFSVYGTSEYNSYKDEVGKNKLLMNLDLFLKFQTFESAQDLTIGALNIFIKPTGSNSVYSDFSNGSTSELNNSVVISGTPIIVNSTLYYRMTQDVETLASITDLSSIQLRCNSMPILSELNSSTLGSSDRFVNMLTDFEPLLDNNFSNGTPLQYNPQIYRWFCLGQADSLRNMDVQVVWTDTKGKEYPVYITKNSVLNIKIVFKKHDCTDGE